VAAVRNFCFAIAFLFVLCRLFTGIVYEYQDPTAYYVIKHTPSFAIEQEGSPTKPIASQFTVIYGDEMEVLFRDQYVALMRWAFGIAGGFLIIAFIAGLRMRLH
jgi:hypothetical protein